MMETLIIRIAPTDAGDRPLAQWALFRGPDRVVGVEQPVTLDEAFARLPVSLGQNRKTVVLLPGADIGLTDITVPPAQRRHQNRILPSLMEDRLAEDVGLVHLAAGPASNGTGRTHVAVVQAALMTRWLDALHDAGFAPQVMTSEIFALPAPDADRWTMLYDGQSVWARTGAHSGFMIEPEALPLMLHERGDGALRHPVIECILTDGATEADMQHLKPFAGTRPVDYRTWPGSAFDCLSRTALQAGAIDAPMLNLLQGAYAPLAVRTGSDRRAGILTRLSVGAFLLALLLNGGQAVYFSRQAAVKQAQIETLYHQSFPADTRLVDPVQQMKNHLNAQQSTSDSGFLSILKLTASRLGADYALDLQTLAYSDENHTLTIDITGQSIDSLNGLARRIDGGALTATLVSVAKDNDVVRAQLSVVQK